jgi:predicted phage terminase large subunit-like protein
MVPTPRQRTFLDTNADEKLYGGSAGGGKSEALLLWLAEGIDIPEYSGIIFRRTYAQLEKSNEGLIAKSFRLYDYRVSPLGGHYNNTRHQWTFPSGAVIDLGHLPQENSVRDYQGPSYHRIAWDELTQFTEGQYEFLQTRLRRKTDFPIKPGTAAGSNPGDEGHRWVKKRFLSPEALSCSKGLGPYDPSPAGSVYWNDNRAFVPARVADNPHLDIAHYIQQLSAVADPVLRERMLAGDWSISEDSEIKQEWLRWYERHGDNYRLLDAHDRQIKVIHPSDCIRFAIGDCAGTSEDKAKEKRGKPASYSVITIWEYATKDGFLILRDMKRGRWGFVELCSKLRQANDEHQPSWIGLENEKFGLAALDILKDLPTRGISHEGKDKLQRMADASNMLEQGKIFFPKVALWRTDLENEFLSWDGHPDTQADIIDCLAYAARHCRRKWGGGPIILEAFPIMGMQRRM